jgi:hypothetical protein
MTKEAAEVPVRAAMVARVVARMAMALAKVAKAANEPVMELVANAVAEGADYYVVEADGAKRK